jgi:hypothetical protein
MERRIAVLSDVKDLSEWLNGASVEQAHVVQAGGRLQLVLDLTRAMTEAKRVVRVGLLKRVKTPWTKCQVRLSGINAVTVKRLADLAPDQTPLLSCEAVTGGYQLTVQAPDGLQLVLALSQLDGSFADIGSPIEAP